MVALKEDQVWFRIRFVFRVGNRFVDQAEAEAPALVRAQARLRVVAQVLLDVVFLVAVAADDIDDIDAAAVAVFE